MFLKKTHLRQGYVATFQTDFFYLNDACLELYYAFMGESYDTTLTLKVKHEVGPFLKVKHGVGPLLKIKHEVGPLLKVRDEVGSLLKVKHGVGPLLKRSRYHFDELVQGIRNSSGVTSLLH